VSHQGRPLLFVKGAIFALLFFQAPLCILTPEKRGKREGENTGKKPPQSNSLQGKQKYCYMYLIYIKKLAFIVLEL